MIEKNIPLRVIVTGATGMVGEGVLQECLLDPDVEAVLVINRKPCGVQDPKLKEIIHSDFFDISAIEVHLSGYNACFFCLGVSSVGMKEPEYFRLTHTLTLHVADTLCRLNPDMVFGYISGSGTDNTERGRIMWARVKGKTENDLMKLPFKGVFVFRPGYMHATPGLKNTLPAYKYFSWLYPLLRPLFPKFFSTLGEMGRAMINSAKYGFSKQILEVNDINALAEK